MNVCKHLEKNPAVTYRNRGVCQYRNDQRAGWTDQDGKGHLHLHVTRSIDLLYKVLKKIAINVYS